MPTYISLIHFTQKGVETIKDGPKRLDAARQAFRAAGAELKAFYLVTGRYDAIATGEPPNDERLRFTPCRPEAADGTSRGSSPSRARRLAGERCRGWVTYRNSCRTRPWR